MRNNPTATFTLTKELMPAHLSKASDETAFISGAQVSDSNLGAAWQHIIDYYLVEWGSNGLKGYEETEGLLAPSKDVIATAIEFSIFLASKNYFAPNRAVPNGEGGLVLERSEAAAIVETIEVLDRSNIEISTFSDGKLVRRTPIVVDRAG